MESRKEKMAYTRATNKCVKLIRKFNDSRFELPIAIGGTPRKPRLMYLDYDDRSKWRWLTLEEIEMLTGFYADIDDYVGSAVKNVKLKYENDKDKTNI